MPLLAVVVAVPLIWRLNQPMVVTWPVKGAYDTIEKMPADKLAIIIITGDRARSRRAGRRSRR